MVLTLQKELWYKFELISFTKSLTTVKNKADLDSGIKTKDSKLALKSYLDIPYSGRYGDILYSAHYF